jgi:RNA polymerase sigma factor
MSREFELKLKEAKECSENRNEFIKSYFPFVVKCVSDYIGCYVAVGDADELSVGLIAFNEAIEKYDFDKGAFLAFAKLVINSRLNTFLVTKKDQFKYEPMEILDLVCEIPQFDSDDLSIEIDAWKLEMSKFDITFQKLMENKPKHKDSRERAISISERSSKNHEVVQKMYSKLRLPIELIHTYVGVSRKVIENSKIFITSVILIFTKELEALKKWIQV